MVQKAIPPEKRRGRPPAFDRETVVSAAEQAFWSQGYQATTLSDLEAATGVDRSTLYNSFGGKEGIYRSATAAYVNHAEDYLFSPMHHGTNGIADIVEFIDRLDTMLRSGDCPSGCLIVNDMADPTDREATSRYLERLESGLRAALQLAAAAGDTDPARTEHRCQVLMATVIGVNLVNRNAADNAAAQPILNGMRAEVISWGLQEDNADSQATFISPEPT